eukprot:TRINITY_DN2571_c0_g1_i2.p1 TRINITY_DN2571_c0_g1~~TRINITY_DN2571_c0_g1_i2.p1  ORF type:complete len:312 (-),score=46.12 TRINITY_DN2571_c0_g1_i2:168-1103(-)
MTLFCQAIKREAIVINLDPANEKTNYECAIDVRELINIDFPMDELNLGPNGGLMYCMEYIEKNFDWLEEKLKKYKGKYLLFDMPGQIELYTHHHSTPKILAKLQKAGHRLTAVNLVDSHYCTVPSLFISVLLTSLSTMIHLEMPHINILSKVDLLPKYGKLAFNLEFYTDVLDLDYLLQFLEDEQRGDLDHDLQKVDDDEDDGPVKLDDDNDEKAEINNQEPQGEMEKKFHKLNKSICELVNDYSLVAFIPLNVMDKDNMEYVLRTIDKSNGYVYGGLTSGNEMIFTVADSDAFSHAKVDDIQEKYFDPIG